MTANAHYARRGGWSRADPSPPLGFDLTGKTLGLIGFGRIGRETAMRARAFGMDIVYFDPLPQDDGGLATALPLADVLRTADVVSLHVNLIPETHHLISAREFALMKPTAWIVNTARGPVIDHVALADALRDGRIAGAALDVMETEPPPADEPLLAMPNVIVLPHIGSATVETRAAMLEMSVSNLLAALNGDPPRSCVNPEALAHARHRR